MLSLFNQVEPAISKQVEFSNGFMHADTWHEFTNTFRTSESKASLCLNMVLLYPHTGFYGMVYLSESLNTQQNSIIVFGD